MTHTNIHNMAPENTCTQTYPCIHM